MPEIVSIKNEMSVVNYYMTTLCVHCADLFRRGAKFKVGAGDMTKSHYEE